MAKKQPPRALMSGADPVVMAEYLDLHERKREIEARISAIQVAWEAGGEADVPAHKPDWRHETRRVVDFLE